jgi:VCBS repeat-containing protein
MIMQHHSGNVLNSASGGVPCNADGTATQWVTSNTWINGGYYRYVFNGDGSAECYGSADGSTFTKYAYWNAGAFTKVGTGYVAFMGNGLQGTLTIDDFYVGVADNKDLDNLTWQIEESFSDPENIALEFDPINTAATGLVFEPSADYKALVMNSPASGSGIIYKNDYALAQDSEILFDASLKITPTTLGSKALGIAYGLSADATDTTTGGFLGLRAGTTKAEAVVSEKGTEKAVVEIETDQVLNQSVTLNARVKKADDGFVLDADVAGVTVADDLLIEVAEGRIGIAVQGDGESIANVSLLTIGDFRGVVSNARNLKPDLSKGLDHNWYLHSTTGSVADGITHEDGHVYIDQDKELVVFDNATDLSVFETKKKYANFDLKFKANKQALNEDVDPIIPESTWLGVSMGREELGEAFADNGTDNVMMYWGKDTCDTLPAADRAWLTEDEFFTNHQGEGEMFSIHIIAQDGTVKMYLTAPGAEEDLTAPKLVRTNWDTYGHIAFVCTVGGRFWISDIELTNLDNVELESNSAPVVSDYSESIRGGQTLNGQVEATDADEGETFTYELVEDNTQDYGSLTFNNDGSYTFVADDDAEAGNATFTYRAFDTEDYSEAKTVTIAVTPKALAPTGATEAEYTLGSGDLVIEFDAKGETVSEVKVGSKTLGSSDYAYDESSMALTIKEAALSDLEAGNVDIVITTEGGSITCALTVLAASSGGCGGSITATAICGVAALLGIVAFGLVRRKKED